MTFTIGTEVKTYRSSNALTGVTRVVRETHRALLPRLASRGLDLRPVITGTLSASVASRRIPYVGSDEVLRFPELKPEAVDVLLLLDPTPDVDFSQIAGIRRERGLPVIAMVQDVLPLSHPEWFYPHAREHYRITLQQVFHVADHVIVPSAQARDDFLGLGWPVRAQMHVIPLGTAFKQEAPVRLSADSMEMLYVSTIAPRKGHRRLLNAFDQLRRSGWPVRLTLAGRIGWRVDDLVQDLCNHPEFGTSLQWYEHADDAKVSELKHRATLGVLPSEGEGFGLFLEEALSAGLMVVTSDLPVFRERAHKNVVFAGPGVTDLADTIVKASMYSPAELAPGELRTMHDFGNDVADLVMSVIGGTA